MSSEDNNEDVLALLFVGQVGDVANIVDNTRVPPGKQNDDTRFVELSYDLNRRSITGKRAPSGCYAVTMVVSHRFDLAARPESPDDEDRLVWWVIAGTPDEVDAIKAIGGCPNHTP